MQDISRPRTPTIFAHQMASFEGLTTYSFPSFGLGTEGRSAHSRLQSAANFFDVLAVTPAAGRLFSAAERTAGRRAGRHREVTVHGSGVSAVIRGYWARPFR